MQLTLPGTTIEVSAYTKDVAENVLSHIFYAGGLVLSQMSMMTGLETHTIQNWVKRGFLTPPVHRQYSRRQFMRVVIINLLRQNMQIEHIIKLLSYINGQLNTESDDTIDDSELYNRFVNLIGALGCGLPDEKSLSAACEDALEGYKEVVPGSRHRVVRVLQVMVYQYFSVQTKQTAERILLNLD